MFHQTISAQDHGDQIPQNVPEHDLLKIFLGKWFLEGQVDENSPAGSGETGGKTQTYTASLRGRTLVLSNDPERAKIRLSTDEMRKVSWEPKTSRGWKPVCELRGTKKQQFLS